MNSMIASLAILLLNTLALAVIIGYIAYLLSRLSKGRPAPFVPTIRQGVSKAIEALGIKKGDIVYDIGAGDGRILFAANAAEPNARYVGIENALIPRAVFCLKYLLKGRPKAISFRKDDFFKVDLSEATAVFAFLLPHVMDELLPKFERELKPGTRVISLQFPFSKKVYDSVIEYTPGILKESASRMYVYRF